MSSQFKPKSGYKEKVIDSFNRQGMMKTINASILAIRPGEIDWPQIGPLKIYVRDHTFTVIKCMLEVAG